MKFKPFKRIPALIALCVVALVCILRCFEPDSLEHLEKITFDMRVRSAARSNPTVATNLGFIYIDEESVRRVWNRSLGYSFGLFWPRQVYGRLVEELALQGARAISFDILFGELRPDHPSVQMNDGSFPESDNYFADQLKAAGTVILAVMPEVEVPPLFATNALTLGDIQTDKDADGILRQARVFRIYRRWHAAFREMEADPEYGVDLRDARVERRQIVLPRHGVEDIKVPLDERGEFEVADLWGTNLPAGMPPNAHPFTEELVWHMGVILAARELNLDLGKAQIDLSHGRVVLPGPNGSRRVIPVDAEGRFYIDWCIPANHPLLTRQPIHDLLAQHRARMEGQTNGFSNLWRGKLAVVGSSAMVGNNLTDRGATPLSKDTLLVSKHWNVANSIITGRFVQRSSLALDLALIGVMGLAAGVLHWRFPVLLATGLVVLTLVTYGGFAFFLYTETRFWLPMVLPLFGALLMTFVSLITWNVVFEQAEQRRVKGIFSTVVSPKIVKELLQASTLSLSGARREVTVMFSDVRGFTELTDANQERAAEFVKRAGLTGEAAETCFNEQARETFETVNLYLGVVAETIIRHDGTLDKFIGDCVMAFWGAPTPNTAHAATCVRAAIEAQRALHELNRQRAEENRKRELENQDRAAAGLEPRLLLPILFMGSGINTGPATVGLMGSAAQSVVRSGSYTVFGREINLASRLESLSGKGRVFISESTYEHLRRDDPTLAATCIPMAPAHVKGIRTAVQVYEVLWRPADSPPLEEEFTAGATLHPQAASPSAGN